VIFMEMPRLNIRMTPTQIGMRNNTQAKLEMTTTKAELHSEYKPPTGNGWTQPKISIDSYESRHTYGYVNHEDYARERGQEGIQIMRANMQKNNADAQAMIKNGAKKGHNEIVEQEKQRIASQNAPPQGMNVVFPPPPTTELVEPSRIKGEIDPGSYKTTVTPAEPFAHGHFTPANVEPYIKQKGDIRQWITYGEYDRLA